MNKATQKFLERAEEAQRASNMALTHKELESAASIAYYGLFFTAQAYVFTALRQAKRAEAVSIKAMKQAAAVLRPFAEVGRGNPRLE